MELPRILYLSLWIVCVLANTREITVQRPTVVDLKPLPKGSCIAYELCANSNPISIKSRDENTCSIDSSMNMVLSQSCTKKNDICSFKINALRFQPEPLEPCLGMQDGQWTGEFDSLQLITSGPATIHITNTTAATKEDCDKVKRALNSCRAETSFLFLRVNITTEKEGVTDWRKFDFHHVTSALANQMSVAYVEWVERRESPTEQQLMLMMPAVAAEKRQKQILEAIVGKTLKADFGDGTFVVRSATWDEEFKPEVDSDSNGGLSTSSVIVLLILLIVLVWWSH